MIVKTVTHFYDWRDELRVFASRHALTLIFMSACFVIVMLVLACHRVTG